MWWENKKMGLKIYTSKIEDLRKKHLKEETIFNIGEEIKHEEEFWYLVGAYRG